MEGCRERWRQAGIDPTNKINYSSCFSWKGRAGSRDPHVGGNLPTFKFKAPLTQPALCRRESPPGGRPVWTHSPRSPSTGARAQAAPKGRTSPGSVLCPDGSGRRGGGRGAERPYPSCCRVLAGFIPSRWGGGFLAFLSFIFGVCERLRSLARRRWVGGGMGRGRPCGGGGWQKC